MRNGQPVVALNAQYESVPTIGILNISTPVSGTTVDWRGESVAPAPVSGEAAGSWAGDLTVAECTPAVALLGLGDARVSSVV